MLEPSNCTYGQVADFNGDPYFKLRAHSIPELKCSPITDWRFISQIAEQGILEVVKEGSTGVCYDHALNSSDLDPSIIQADPIPNLKAQGYQPVSDPKDGDLVIYFNETDLLKGNYSTRWPFTKHLVQHFGLWRDGQVESKWGSHPDVLLHPAQIVPHSYGDACMVFRRGNPPQPRNPESWEEFFE